MGSKTTEKLKNGRESLDLKNSSRYFAFNSSVSRFTNFSRCSSLSNFVTYLRRSELGASKTPISLISMSYGRTRTCRRTKYLLAETFTWLTCPNFTPDALTSAWSAQIFSRGTNFADRHQPNPRQHWDERTCSCVDFIIVVARHQRILISTTAAAE